MKNYLKPLSLIIAILLLNISCKKPQEETSVTDIDGNVYEIVTIGSQVWMQENLKTTKLNDGISIPNTSDSIQWWNLKTTGLCYFKNNITNKDTYGALYNWNTVKTGRLCPVGWHVPTNTEVNTLITYLGGPSNAWRKLAESGTAHWQDTPNNPSTNETGFTALPGRFRSSIGSYTGYSEVAAWWTSTPNNYGSGLSWNLILGAQIYFVDGNSSEGYSIRCLKD